MAEAELLISPMLPLADWDVDWMPFSCLLSGDKVGLAIGPLFWLPSKWPDFWLMSVLSHWQVSSGTCLSVVRISVYSWPLCASSVAESFWVRVVWMCAANEGLPVPWSAISGTTPLEWMWLALVSVGWFPSPEICTWLRHSDSLFDGCSNRLWSW